MFELWYVSTHKSDEDTNCTFAWSITCIYHSASSRCLKTKIKTRTKTKTRIKTKSKTETKIKIEIEIETEAKSESEMEMEMEKENPIKTSWPALVYPGWTTKYDLCDMFIVESRLWVYASWWCLSLYQVIFIFLQWCTSCTCWLVGYCFLWMMAMHVCPCCKMVLLSHFDHHYVWCSLCLFVEQFSCRLHTKWEDPFVAFFRIVLHSSHSAILIGVFAICTACICYC